VTAISPVVFRILESTPTPGAENLLMPSLEILFVDPQVGDLGPIIEYRPSGVGVVALGAHRPAAQQMAAALSNRSGLAAVHVIAHGAPGRVLSTATPATLPRSDGRSPTTSS
jgi:hypothetical protein